MILITGAAGKTGKAIVGALAARGTPVRALVRRPEQIAALHASGATEVIVGDVRDVDDFQLACQQVDTLYHICPNMQPDEVQIAEGVIAAAKAQGVTRLVYHSVLHPQTATMPHHWQKLQVEDLLFTAGLDYTILQPAAYMQNVLAGWQSVVQEGIYRVPYAASTRLAMVDLADVAQAAAHVLTTPGHQGATYELGGDEWLTQDQVAVILGEVLERPVRVAVQARDEWQTQAQKAHLSDYAIDTLLKMFDYYERYGFCGNGQVLTWLLGRSPTKFADFVRAQEQVNIH